MTKRSKRLRTQFNETAPAPIELLNDRILNLHQIADFLNVSKVVARSLLRAGQIDGFKAGGQWRARQGALIDFVIEGVASRK